MRVTWRIVELSEEVLGYLRDEAYAYLCGEAVRQQLAQIEKERSELETTRPPFGGMLARRDKREKFENTRSQLSETEDALRTRLGKIESIDAELRHLLEAELANYLAEVSPDYGRFPQIAARLYDWEASFQRLPEQLLAFARDARSLRLAASGAGATRRTCAQDLAVLRDTAGRLERQFNELLIIEQAAAELIPAGAEQDIRLPSMPDLRLCGWVDEIATQPLPQLIASVSHVEATIREFLAHGAEKALEGLQLTRDACAKHQGLLIENYWNQLREHARQHFVEAGDVDVILEQLVQRYINDDLSQRQNNIVRDPFAAER